jgi:hypothetical protein
MHTEFWWINLLESVHLEDRDEDGKGGNDGMWMELAQNHVQWRALVLAVLNLGVLLPEN